MKFVEYEKQIPAFLLPYLDAEEMQRLKKVDMNCGMNFTSVPLFQSAEPYSRYTHSLGVALIVYHYTKDPVQTLAGLFHDIATPAFSHVIDFMHGDAMKQESTEDLTQSILKHSAQIMYQLKADGIALSQVSDYHLYPIADNDSPMLSADRLEYTLGAAIDYHFASAEQLQPLYDDIVVSSNEAGEKELVFTHLAQAVQFTKTALQNGHVFTSQEDRCCMEMLAGIVKKAIALGILKEEDLYTEEENVTRILGESSLKEEWQAYQKIKHVISSSKQIPGWIQIQAKKRYIDPYCLETKKRVSQSDTDIKNRIDDFLQEDQQEWMKGIA